MESLEDESSSKPPQKRTRKGKREGLLQKRIRKRNKERLKEKLLKKNKKLLKRRIRKRNKEFGEGCEDDIQDPDPRNYTLEGDHDPSKYTEWSLPPAGDSVLLIIGTEIPEDGEGVKDTINE